MRGRYRSCCFSKALSAFAETRTHRWLESRYLERMSGQASGQAVYRAPYNSLEALLELFSGSPEIAHHVRRLWFDGFETPETSRLILKILGLCEGLRSVALPWTALRFCDANAWKAIFCHSKLSSLEFNAVHLKEAQSKDPAYQMDLHPLRDLFLNFGRITRLKIVGSTNIRAITDEDLQLLARTATRLEELHVIGTAVITIEGVFALANASSHSLRVLEYSPAEMATTVSEEHCCQAIQGLSSLQDVDITLPSICSEIFADPNVKWMGDLRIKAARICSTSDTQQRNSATAEEDLKLLLDKARQFIAERDRQLGPVDLEIGIRKQTVQQGLRVQFVNAEAGNWIFEPAKHKVHGDVGLGKILSSTTTELSHWPTSESPSPKGTYCCSKDEGTYSCISEADFVAGLRHGWLSLY